MNDLLLDAREMRRLAEDAATLARCQDLWRIRSDLAAAFTTPEQWLDAADELARLLER